MFFLIALKGAGPGDFSKPPEPYLYGFLVFMAVYSLLTTFLLLKGKFNRAYSIEKGNLEGPVQESLFLDPLTGLPDRRLFSDRLKQALLMAGRENQALAILMIDMNRFKEINNTLGPRYGDMALQQIGNRLREKIRKSDTLSRLGGDQFAVLLLGAKENGAMDVADKLLRTMEEPVVLEGFPLEIAARIGVALYPEHGERYDDLLRCAEVAMESAKEEVSGCSIYKSVKDQYTTQRLMLLGELRQAIDDNQLFMVYQPKIHLKSRRVIGTEALVRWKHPKQGIIPPDQFIPIAENSGLIKPMSAWVINHVLNQCQEWDKSGVLFPVAINLSRRSLHDPNLVTQIIDSLDRHRIGHQWIEFEITESTIMANAAAAMKILSRLNELGIRLSIDDFGTGYSSLASLKKLPVQSVKIDKSFVSNMATDKNDEMIVSSTVDLAHHLGLEVVAEGVETEENWNRLAEMGCDQSQGYYISPPLPPDQLIHWLRKSSWCTEAV
ncbi:MAG: bifunctional diguanylate cyclase/phosphodiesterase [Nitrospirae bacterium]|nr:bifunctional diguanylate cyclase/phosphodiesterase [Nitrospirota bacterium]